jgi:LPXTG-motif cell wall-anchored protein
VNKFKKLLAVSLSVATLAVGMLPLSVSAANVVRSTEPPKVAEISLTKASSKPDCTDGNPNYSLAGAEYSVYKDEGCSQYVGKMITDSKGSAKISNLPLNIYWVKETKASTGYGKDGQKYRCDLRSGNSAVIKSHVNSKEPPLMDPVRVLIRKQGEDLTPDASKGQTLADAHFEFKFYANKPTTVDPATRGERPKWVWVLKTNKDGFCYMLDSYKVSGPEFPKDDSGSVGFPFGTITVKEVKAPNGYLVNPKVFVVPVDSKTSTVGPVFQEPTIKDKSVKIDLVKYQDGFDGKKYAIPGAVFKHTFPNGKSETATTDSEGKISFKGLTQGDHVIEEVKVPDGFSVNKNKITFTVSKDNKITVTSNNVVTDTDGKITVSVGSDGNMDGTIENKVVPFDLNIHKINDKNFSLQGAEFTLYSDSTCNTVVKKATSDERGNLSMSGLICGKEYYLKETKAPTGYRIPVNEDGSDIVWKIKTESYPTLDKFIFYVNDKQYTTGTGQFHISGTKADRDANMELINEIGKKLPNTGSYGMILLVVIGLGLIASSSVLMKKEVKR